MDANNNLVWESGWFGSGRHAEASTVALDSGTYWWSARARRGTKEGSAGDGRPFHVNFVPGQPEKIAPIHDAWVGTRSPILQWNDPGDGDGYFRDYRDYYVEVRQENGTLVDSIGWGYRDKTWTPRLPEDGHYFWTVKAGDGMEDNGFGPQASFWVDTTPPSMTATADASGTTAANSITLSVIAADAGSGVQYIAFRTKDATPVKVNAKTATWSFDTSQISGAFTVEAYAVDNAGNACSAQRFDFNIDHSAPVTTCVISPAKPDGANNWYRVNPTVTLSANAPSGIASTWIQVGAGEWQKYTAPVQVKQGGVVTVSYYSIGGSGIQEQPHTTSVAIDTTPPTTPIPIDEGSVTPSPSKLSVLLNSYDAESGQKAVLYMVGKAPNDGSYRKSTTVYTSLPYLTIDGLFLPANLPVYVTLRTVNSAGSATPWVATDGILSDPLGQATNANTWVIGSAGTTSLFATGMITGTLGQPFASLSTLADYSGALDSGFYPTMTSCMASFRATLQDYVGPVANVPITMIVRPAGSSTILSWQTCGVGSNGNYYGDVGSPGAYDITIKAPHWKSMTAYNMRFGVAGSTMTAVSLKNGDVNGDDKIDAADMTLLVAALGSQPGSANWNAQADLNGDGAVNATDQAILAKNLTP